MNGATDGATMESRQPSALTNAVSAADWQVMIEYVNAVPGLPRPSQENPRSLIRLGFFVSDVSALPDTSRHFPVDALTADPNGGYEISHPQIQAVRGRTQHEHTHGKGVQRAAHQVNTRKPRVRRALRRNHSIQHSRLNTPGLSGAMALDTRRSPWRGKTAQPVSARATTPTSNNRYTTTCNSYPETAHTSWEIRTNHLYPVWLRADPSDHIAHKPLA